MCLGIPGEVIEIRADQPDLATVAVCGVRRPINIGLLVDDPPGPGDWILIHVGFALARIDEDEAAAAMRFLETMGPVFTDEVDALRESELDGPPPPPGRIGPRPRGPHDEPEDTDAFR